MTFEQPWALALLALVPLLWLVRHRTPRRRILVAAPYFWTSQPQPDTARWSKTIARHPLVWVQTALAVLLIAALAGPRVTAAADAVAVVLDLSMSMGARDGTGTRLSAALERAREIVTMQPRSTRVVVWAAGAAPRRIADGSAGSGLPPGARTVRTTDGWVDLQAAVSAAAQDASAPHRIYVISDGRVPVRHPRAEWVPVGRPVDNVALAGLVAWRAGERPEDLRVTAVLRNYGTMAATPTLTVTDANGTLLRQQLSVAAGRAVSVMSTLPGAPAQGLLTARLDTADGLAADNVRYATVEASVPTRALVVGRNTFVNAALDALGTVEVVAAVDQPHDVVLCLECQGPPPGRLAALVIPPRRTRQARPVPVTVVRPDHPTVHEVTLDGIDVVPQDAVSLAEGDVVIARAGGTPILVAREPEGRRLLYLNIDATDPAVALNPAFPLLVSRMLEWLGGALVPPAEMRAGDPFVWRPGQEGIERAKAVAPGGLATEIRPAGGAFVVADTSVAGPYRLEAGGQTVRFVVNPASRDESDLSSAPDVPARPRPDDGATQPTGAPGTSLVPACLVVALVLLLVESRIRYRMSRAAATSWRWPRIAVRLASAALIVAAIAGLRIWTGAAPVAIAFVIDRSDSTAAAWRAFEDAARGFAGSLDGSDRTGLVIFGASAAVERRVQAGVPSWSAFESQIDGSATNLEEALRVARGLLPADHSDRRLVVFTDGRQTTGDARREAALAAAESIRIDVLAPPEATRITARASRVVAPAAVRADEGFEVTVVVEGPAGGTGRLRLLGAGQPQEQPVSLPAEGSTSVRFTVPAAQPGVRAFQATFIPDATAFDVGVPEPDAVQAGAVVAVVSPLRLLRATEGAVAPANLPALAGFHADTIAAAQLPSGAALSAYDAVVLDDVDPGTLRPEQRTALAHYVDGGGGLLVLGTERSLPPNQTGDADFDELLPVDTRPRSGARGSTMALVVAFDKSGSMEELVSGTAKIEYARQAVRSLMQVVPAGDAVGVVAFDGATTTVAPMSPTRDAAGLDAALRRLRPEGATAMAPALSQARAWLDAPELKGVSRRHVLLISDGRTSASDLAAARELIRAGRVTLSVVALGAGTDRAALEETASGSGGRAYFPDDVRQLPTVVARETARVAGGRTVTESFTARLGDHTLTRGLTGAPRFGGYVVTAARPAAEVVVRSHLDDPLLAIGRAGLGRVAVYTADIRSSWSDGFVRWVSSDDLIQRTLRWVARRVDDPSVFASLRGTMDGLEASVETTGGDGSLEVAGTVRTPAGRDIELAFEAASAGRFVARTALQEPGAYVARLTTTGVDGVQATLMRGLYWSAPQEADEGVDTPLLAAIAGTTGGRILTPDTARLDGRRAGYREGRGWFVGLALLLVMADALAAGLERVIALSRRGVGPAPMGQPA